MLGSISACPFVLFSGVAGGINGAGWLSPFLCASPQVTSQDKAPTVVAKVLEKHNQDQEVAPDYELVQLLPEGRGEWGWGALVESGPAAPEGLVWAPWLVLMLFLEVEPRGARESLECCNQRKSNS